jgi:hypothetical protein
VTQRRIVQIISYEGSADWMERLLPRRQPVLFDREGTVKVLHVIELEGEETLLQALHRVLDRKE